MITKLRRFTILAHSILALTAMPAQCADDQPSRWPSRDESNRVIMKQPANGIGGPAMPLPYEVAYSVFFKNPRAVARFEESIRGIQDTECCICEVNRNGEIENRHTDGGILSTNPVEEWSAYPSLSPAHGKRPLVEALQDIEAAKWRMHKGDRRSKDADEIATAAALWMTHPLGRSRTITLEVAHGRKLIAVQDYGTGQWHHLYASVPGTLGGIAYQTMTTGYNPEFRSAAPHRVAALRVWMREPDRFEPSPHTMGPSASFCNVLLLNSALVSTMMWPLTCITICDTRPPGLHTHSPIQRHTHSPSITAITTVFIQ